MRKIRLKWALIVMACIAVSKVHAQIEKPVHWSYAAKKLSGDTWAIFLRATIDKGWHIYAQKQSRDAIAVPTQLSFEKIPGLALLGKPVEQGKKETYRVKEVGITNFEYAGQVDFVQKVRLTPGVNTIKGSIIFQSCTHERCLPEDTFSFTIPITQ